MPAAAKYRARGDCISCGKAREAGKMRCPSCILKYRKGSKEWRERMLSENRCCSCAKPNDNLPQCYCLSCKANAKSRRERFKIEVFAAYGGPVCVCCGETMLEFLTLDHINNDGQSHRRQVFEEGVAKRRTRRQRNPLDKYRDVDIYHWLRRNGFPKIVQVMCMNCNFAKGRFGECPHHRAKPKSNPNAGGTEQVSHQKS